MATTEPAPGAPQAPDPARKATVLACLPNAMFRLQTEDGRQVLAHVAGDLRMKVTRLLPGDVVLVECSPFDPGKARICGLGGDRCEPAGGLRPAQPDQNQPRAATNPKASQP